MFTVLGLSVRTSDWGLMPYDIRIYYLLRLVDVAVASFHHGSSSWF